MDEPDRSLVLRLFGPAEPIEGDVRSGEDPPRGFGSWMEMVALIERWRAEQMGDSIPDQPEDIR